jgi:hypothetical protein
MNFRVHRTALVVALLVTSILAAACGGGGTEDTMKEGGLTTVAASAPTTAAPETTESSEAPETSAGPTTSDLPDPCALLTAADIEAATGIPCGEGTFNADLSSEAVAICDWISNGDEFATAQTLIVAGPEAFDSSKETAADIYTLIDVEIPGAEQAYATEEGSLIAMFLKGYFLQVAFLPSGPGNVLEQTTKLATEAASNL